MKEKTKDLEQISNRIEDYFEKANNKFKNKKYLGYKTILLIEYSSPFALIQNSLEGIFSMHFESSYLIGISKRNKNLLSEMNLDCVGAVIFWPRLINIDKEFDVKKRWLDKLKGEWIDGDSNKFEKTADFENHKLKCCIELKREDGRFLKDHFYDKKIYYFDNPFSKDKFSQEQCECILGSKLVFLELNNGTKVP
jgi:hypothetical protein